MAPFTWALPYCPQTTTEWYRQPRRQNAAVLIKSPCRFLLKISYGHYNLSHPRFTFSKILVWIFTQNFEKVKAINPSANHENLTAGLKSTARTWPFPTDQFTCTRPSKNDYRQNHLPLHLSRDICETFPVHSAVESGRN